jgi:hypothetical protein
VDKKEPKKDLVIRVQEDLRPYLDEYSNEKKIPVSKAVNEILASYFRDKKDQNDPPATKKDIKEILNKIGLLSDKFEPILIETLGASWSLMETNKDKEMDTLRDTIMKSYTDHILELENLNKMQDN